MVKLQRRPFGEPDDVREIPYGRLETYDMGDIRIGLCVSGSARILMREGAELLVEAGQFYEVPPGHDSWVVGDEPWITIDLAAEHGVRAYGGRWLRPSGGDAPGNRHRGLHRPCP